MTVLYESSSKKMALDVFCIGRYYNHKQET
jgi:hypothetical protein